MAVPEEAVIKPTFKPKNPALINTDDWPTFSLRKGKVVSQESGEPVSLLSAHKDHPVKVTGYLLEIEEDLQHLGTSNERMQFRVSTERLLPQCGTLTTRRDLLN